MKIQQISLFVENKPGHISAPARLLAQEGIDIRSLYLADTQQYGIVRMIVSDWQKAAGLLEAHGFAAKVTEVLAVQHFNSIEKYLAGSRVRVNVPRSNNRGMNAGRA